MLHPSCSACLQVDTPTKKLLLGVALAYIGLVVILPFVNVFIQVGCVLSCSMVCCALAPETRTGVVGRTACPRLLPGSTSQSAPAPGCPLVLSCAGPWCHVVCALCVLTTCPALYCSFCFLLHPRLLPRVWVPSWRLCRNTTSCMPQS